MNSLVGIHVIIKEEKKKNMTCEFTLVLYVFTANDLIVLPCIINFCRNLAVYTNQLTKIVIYIIKST